MKLKFKHLIAFALIGVLGYSACQKSSSSKTPATTVNYNAIASQIALSLNSSLTGQYGGASINDGVKAPSSLGVNKTGKALFAFPFCGSKVDTTYSSYTTSGDTSKWLLGELNFTFTCSEGSAVNGYTVYDSLRTQNYNTTFVDDYTNAQNYTFKTIDSTTSSLSGTISTQIANSINATSTAPQVYHALSCHYLLTGLVIKKINGVTDVTAGSATYTSKTSEIDASTGQIGLFVNYTGSMTWIGNHKADLTIDPGHKYIIDFTTKTITPAP
jgi:hypothetical protein